MRLPVKLAVLGTALLLTALPASATVVSWGYSITSAFTSATYTDGSSWTGSAGTLAWGDPASSAGQSSLAVGGSPSTGTVSTYYGVTPPKTPPYLGTSTSLTHTNNPVFPPSLTSALLTNTVVLTASSGGVTQIVPFNIAFTETTNSGTCAVAGSPTPCNDIFVLTGGLLNFSFAYDDDDPDLIADTYYVNIFPTTGGVLSTLENSACAAAGVGIGCIGFSTPEGDATTLAFGFTISTAPLSQVPEPGALALVGIGLLGLWARRRRN